LEKSFIIIKSLFLLPSQMKFDEIIRNLDSIGTVMKIILSLNATIEKVKEKGQRS